ncbi:MAG TPA: YgiT-type zinc finger protein [Pyrinomonadaceae bacterium]|nr:YgiT-type zinc finger protein [Pyrinomonadaceae bacterium]
MTSANTTKKKLYGQKCEYCHGKVRPKKIDREAFKYRKGFVILEGVTIGVCDACGMRYYSADILHEVHDIATGVKPFDRIEKIPVSHMPG